MMIKNSNSNTVIKLNNKYLYKQFPTKGQFNKDISGMYLFSLLTKEKTPLLVSGGENFYISECIPNTVTSYELIKNKLLTKEQINIAVASFVAGTYWSYKYFDKTKMELYSFLKWANCLLQIQNKFLSNKNTLLKYLSGKEFSIVAKNLREIAKSDENSKHLTLTHRDIHLDNILVKQDCGYDKFYIIDFEHCMEAPIEMEFQNSLLWNDEKSLDVEEIINLLEQEYRVPYSKEKEKKLAYVYFANQLNLAAEADCKSKAQTLVSKFKSR